MTTDNTAEQWLTCAKCNRKRLYPVPFDLSDFLCRYCFGVQPVFPNTQPPEAQPADTQRERGLVIMSALLNFVDYLNAENIISQTETDRGQLVLRFLESHSNGENYFMCAEEIAERLCQPFQNSGSEGKSND